MPGQPVREEELMPTYLMLANWTEQGIKSYRDSVSRYRQAQKSFSKLGLTLKDTYWVIGPYDIASIAEAPDDETLTAGMLALGSEGNLRTTTMRLFSADEMEQIISRAS
jgi:uncharacterized protein with GYD domain